MNNPSTPEAVFALRLLHFNNHIFCHPLERGERRANNFQTNARVPRDCGIYCFPLSILCSPGLHIPYYLYVLRKWPYRCFLDPSRLDFPICKPPSVPFSPRFSKCSLPNLPRKRSRPRDRHATLPRVPFHGRQVLVTYLRCFLSG